MCYLILTCLITSWNVPTDTMTRSMLRSMSSPCTSPSSSTTLPPPRPPWPTLCSPAQPCSSSRRSRRETGVQRRLTPPLQTPLASSSPIIPTGRALVSADDKRLAADHTMSTCRHYFSLVLLLQASALSTWWTPHLRPCPRDSRRSRLPLRATCTSLNILQQRPSASTSGMGSRCCKCAFPSGVRICIHLLCMRSCTYLIRVYISEMVAEPKQSALSGWHRDSQPTAALASGPRVLRAAHRGTHHGPAAATTGRAAWTVNPGREAGRWQRCTHGAVQGLYRPSHHKHWEGAPQSGCRRVS